MIGLRSRLARSWRAHCDRRARLAVLVLGDSHVRVFEHWWFMWALPHVRWHVVYVPGGSVAGLANPRSVTQARSAFDEALATVPHDFVLLNLGEVDTGYNLWARAGQRKAEPQALLADLVRRYREFIEHVARNHRLIVVGAPLPTLPDEFVPADDVGATRRKVRQKQPERTALTLDFNARVAQACDALGIPHLDDRRDSLGRGGIVRPSWQRKAGPDHHYDRSTYARWLARTLAPLLRNRPG